MNLADWLSKNGIRLLVIIGIVAIVGTLYGTKISQIVRLEAQKRELQQNLVSEKKRSNRLNNELKSIKSKHYVEYIAHKNLGLVYPDEQIVIKVNSQAEAKKQQKKAEKQAAEAKQKNTSDSQDGATTTGVDQ
ncbi:septum formation initiator family protein [uncultured Pseudoramibacter sp.]|uniref:FtsB family cell division protein n=1 Tax=uncultured Pseudoramibacter sp. TaxID=1623493 RepID=UPI0025E3F7EA|nr:septum formation initiator family protein [uncultured Pseudoramibacter sp.]